MAKSDFERFLSLIVGDMERSGVNVLDPQWRPGLSVFILLAICAMQPYLSFVAFLRYYSTLELLAESLSITVTYVQVMGRFYFYGFQRESCRAMVQNLREQRRQFGANSNPAIEDLFWRADRRLLITYRLLYYAYITAMASFITMPLLFPDERKYSLLLAFNFPFLPPDGEPVWWYFTYLYHAAMIWKCLHFLVVVDCVMVMAMMSVCTRLQALKLLVRQLDEDVQASPMAATAHLDPAVDRIVELHVSIKRFMGHFSDEYSLHFFFILGTACFEICMALNVISITPRCAVYPYLMASMFKLFLMCFFGNLVLMENDTLPDCIYGIQWHRMTVSQQKKIGFILANAQPDMEAHAVFMPVKMASFITILRAAYSYFTILQSGN